MKNLRLKAGIAIALCTTSLAFSQAGMAQAAQKVRVNIPAQELSAALIRFGRETGSEIVFSLDAVREKKTVALRGEYDRDDALEMLLKGSGLTYRITTQGAILIEPLQARAQYAAVGPVLLAQSESSGSAQNSGVTPAEGARNLAEIVVSATRVQRSGYEAPTPTVMVGMEDFAASGKASVQEYIAQLPQLGISITASTLGPVASSTSSGTAQLNLRGLGVNRTLVLLDGRRVVASALASNSVDVNLLPTNLLERADIVSGGASAAYGSDAMAGVVNFVLDTDYTGFKTDVQTGITEEGDGENYSANAAFGTPIGRNGHLLLSGNYHKTTPIKSVSSRDWYKGWSSINNPDWTPTNGQPANFMRNDTGFSLASHGGLITSGPMRGTAFGPNGQLEQFVFGPIQAGLRQAGGTVVDTPGQMGLLSKIEYYSMFGRFSFDFDNDVNAYVELSSGHSWGQNHGPLYIRNGNIRIAADNYYLPDELRAYAPFMVGRTNMDMIAESDRFHIAENTRDLFRAVMGAGGRLFLNGSWNAYYQFGQVDLLTERLNNPIIQNYDLAIDSVANPAVNGVAGVAVGAPVCRSTLTNPNNGCVPMNIFGYGSPSQAALNYVMGVTQGVHAQQGTIFKQSVVAVDGQIEPFSTWAGVATIAAGLEYRKEAYRARQSDPVSQVGGWFSGNYVPSQGEYDVKEVFTEGVIPLLRDKPFAQATDLNLAFRWTDYSISGEVETWKVGLTHEFGEQVRVRGALSRDIRAPNLNDLFQAGTTSTPLAIDPLLGGTNVLIRGLSGGNLALTPEIADTTTFGVVYRPIWLPDLSFSVDYYDIDITDAIVALGPQDIINQCYGWGVAQNTSVCGNITLATPGTLEGALVRTGGVNAQQVKRSGIDYELTYRKGVDFLSGTFDVRLLISQALTDERVLSGQVEDLRGVYTVLGGSGPDFRGRLSLGFRAGPSQTTLIVRHLGEGKMANNWPNSHPSSLDRKDVPSTTYFDLSQSYGLELGSANLTLYGSINNLFSKDPPPVANPGGTLPTDIGASVWHDLLGRSFSLGVRASF